MHTTGYELLYIVSSTKNDEEVKNVISAVNEILAKFSAVILHHGPWNKRALEYKIRGVEHGTYILVYFTVEENSLGAISTALKHTPNLIRSIIIKHNDVEPAKRAFFEYYEEIKNKRRPVPHARYFEQARPPARPIQHTHPAPAPIKQPIRQVAITEDHSLAIIEETPKTPSVAAEAEKPQTTDEVIEKTVPKKDEPPVAPQKNESERDAPAETAEKTKGHHSKPMHRKPVKKPTLAELDTKLKQILEGEIEL